MIPSNKWFPQSLQERAAWYDNFATQFAALGVTLGFKAVDVTSVANDNAVMQFVANAAVTLEAYKDAVRQYRIVITEGNIGDPTPIFPADISLATPGLITTGIFERLDDFVKRIRVSPDYTPEIGAIFGIIPSSPTPTPEGDLKPVIKAGESFGGYKFDVNVTRLGMEAFKVQVQKNGNGNWADAAFATNNPVEVTVTPATPDAGASPFTLMKIPGHSDIRMTSRYTHATDAALRRAVGNLDVFLHFSDELVTENKRQAQGLP